MEWRRFQFWYQPSEALNEGSADSSFAFWRSINPLTAKPIKPNEITRENKIQAVKDCLHSLLSQHLKLTNRKRPFPRTGNKLTCLVFSKLFYCSNVWANCSKLNVDKLQSVQNFACRIVSGIRKYDHVTPELQRLRWLPVSSQLYYRNAILAFKCMYGRAPEYLSTFFTKRCDVNRYTTRSSQLLNVPLFKTASGQRTFYYRTVSIWNSLESFLKLSSNESIFKKRLRSKLLRDFLGCD